LKTSQKLIYLPLFIFFILSHVNSGTFSEKKFEFGIAPGVLFSGDVYISLYGDNVTQKSTLLLRTYADAYIIPQLAFGLYFNYTTLNLENDIEIFDKQIKKSGTSIWEIGGSIKPRFILSEELALKPGLSVGHRRFAGDDDFTTWKGLALNASCEVQYCLSTTVYLMTEIGFLYQPYGGNVDTDITFDPMFYWVIGIAL
jgi:hypothetical protein